jgi:hypothetical protein
MTHPLRHFLLVFDHASARLVREQTFDHKIDLALHAYRAAEQEFADRPLMEIVLVGSDSMETVRLTHANYFADEVEGSEFLLGV